MLTTVIGPAVGAALIAAIGTRNVFYLDSASLLFSAIMIFEIGLKESSHRSTARIARIWSQMSEGLAFIRSNRGALFVVSMYSAVMLAFGGVNVLFLAFIREVLGMGIRGLGLLESTQGIGAVVGSVVLGYIGYRIKSRKLTLWSLLAASLFFLAFSPNRIPILSYALIGAVGFGITYSRGPSGSSRFLSAQPWP